MSGRQRGYNLVGLAEVEPICDRIAAERPPGWEVLVGDLRAAMAVSELKRFPPTAFKFFPGGGADVLGRALSAVRNRKEPRMTTRGFSREAEQRAEALAEEYATVRVGLDQSGDLVALLDGLDPTGRERA